MVTIYSDGVGGNLQMFRSVLERRAPASVETVEQALPPKGPYKGVTVKAPSGALLAALTAAYREGATWKRG